MIAPIVDQILAAIEKQPKSKDIKKLLLMKLECELNSSRCIIEIEKGKNEEKDDLE